MPRRIDDQTRFINFVMEAELPAVEATLKTANAIFVSRKKTTGSPVTANTAAEAPKPRRKRSSQPDLVTVAVVEPAVNGATAADPEF